MYNSRGLLVDGPSKISGHHTEIDFVKSNFDEDKLLYIDIERAEQWNKEWASIIFKGILVGREIS